MHGRRAVDRVRSDRGRHRDPVVTVARELPARGCPPRIVSPSAERLDPDAELGEQGGDRRDPVALLHPELGGVGDLGDAVGERGRDREHRDLVLDERDLVAADRRAAQWRGSDHVRSPTGSPSSSPVGTTSIARAHAAQHVDERDASRVERHPLDRDVGARRDRRGDAPEGRRRRIARHRELERRRRTRTDPHRRAVDLDRHAERREHAFGVVAARRRLGDHGDTVGLQPREHQRGLHLRARDRERELGARAATRPGSPAGRACLRLARRPSRPSRGAVRRSSPSAARAGWRRRSSTLRNGRPASSAAQRADRRPRVAAVDDVLRLAPRVGARGRATVVASPSPSIVDAERGEAPPACSRRRRRRGSPVIDRVAVGERGEEQRPVRDALVARAPAPGPAAAAHRRTSRRRDVGLVTTARPADVVAVVTQGGLERLGTRTPGTTKTNVPRWPSSECAISKSTMFTPSRAAIVVTSAISPGPVEHRDAQLDQWLVGGHPGGQVASRRARVLEHVPQRVAVAARHERPHLHRAR